MYYRCGINPAIPYGGRRRKSWTPRLLRQDLGNAPPKVLPRQCAYICFETLPRSSRLWGLTPLSRLREVPKVRSMRPLTRSPSECRVRAATSAVQDFVRRPPYIYSARVGKCNIEYLTPYVRYLHSAQGARNIRQSDHDNT